MQNSPVVDSKIRIHTRPQAVLFRLKALLLQLRRGARNLFDSEIRRYPKADELVGRPAIAESKTPLWTETEPEERFLLAGKAQNLRIAVERLDGLEIPAGATFSFWKHLGHVNRLKGYVVGRELREGCIVPNVGGGLCQLSNALYDAALEAGFEIVERHAHTKVIPGSLAERNRDATVFWNYVDLRFRAAQPFRIEARLGRDHLRVVFRGDRPAARPLVQITKRTIREGPLTDHPNSCATCGVESCFRSLKPDANLDFGRTAFLLDEYAPEFDDYIQKTRAGKDWLFLPLDGRRFNRSNYAWNTGGFGRVRQSVFETILRSYRSRRLAAQGAARQKSLLASAEKLAASYAKKLRFDVTHVVVSQNLLPYLWKSGALGGRTFDVLMTALPMTEIQRRLDAAFERNPQSTTLGDFRAPAELLETEREALINARQIVTPHTEIAAVFGPRAVSIDWQRPAVKENGRRKNGKFTVVFPAATVGRKGCYELREALRDLDVRLLTLGATIEGADFWDGFDREAGGDDWPEKADLVVLPAYVEHRPRRLLLAAARGLPVIASKSCGVGGVAGIETIEDGDAESLKTTVRRLIETGRNGRAE
ncbi:MAG: VanW family protein [Acidobacteria bacterium]|nr:VanW family protein [Acidobacteriota bacterium]